MKVNNEISIVIGSWRSYNECKERALGSKWLKLNNYNTFVEIEDELINDGFVLEEINEELFIQDIEGLPANNVNWDNMRSERLFNTLRMSGVLAHKYQHKTMCAFLEVLLK